MALMAQMAASNQALQQQMQQQNVQHQQSMTAMQQQLQQQAMMLQGQHEAAQHQAARRGVVDAKGVKAPDKFSGAQKDWKAWMFQFEGWVASQFEDGQKLLDDARLKSDSVITSADIDDWDMQHPDAKRMNAQLWTVLTSMTKQGTEALSIVMNSTKGAGLDAWRRLCKKHDPDNPHTNMHMLRKIMQPKESPLNELVGAIETWERDLIESAGIETWEL